MKAQIKINTTAQDFIITLVKIEITGCMHAQWGREGGTPDFKWQEWSNGGKNHNTKKSLGLQTKLPKHTWTKIQPQSQKFHTQKTSSIIPFTWNLAPPPQCMVITQVTPRAPLPVVLGKLEDPSAGLSLRAGGRGFSPATKRVAPGYFYWKIEEK